ncbi:unnamed protein product [Amoebophrya sp. A25]|nr:unnamed protein product [Amoebophrya sp. A25]|eukprot:GSA25T00002690001.1
MVFPSSWSLDPRGGSLSFLLHACSLSFFGGSVLSVVSAPPVISASASRSSSSTLIELQQQQYQQHGHGHQSGPPQSPLGRFWTRNPEDYWGPMCVRSVPVNHRMEKWQLHELLGEDAAVVRKKVRQVQGEIRIQLTTDAAKGKQNVENYLKNYLNLGGPPTAGGAPSLTPRSSASGAGGKAVAQPKANAASSSFVSVDVDASGTLSNLQFLDMDGNDEPTATAAGRPRLELVDDEIDVRMSASFLSEKQGSSFNTPPTISTSSSFAQQQQQNTANAAPGSPLVSQPTAQSRPDGGEGREVVGYFYALYPDPGHLVKSDVYGSLYPDGCLKVPIKTYGDLEKAMRDQKGGFLPGGSYGWGMATDPPDSIPIKNAYWLSRGSRVVKSGASANLAVMVHRDMEIGSSGVANGLRARLVNLKTDAYSEESVVCFILNIILITGIVVCMLVLLATVFCLGHRSEEESPSDDELFDDKEE